jgi:3-hydroxyacyl-CoA dehydrogenase/enoyl-CoA hydratase/3-hydroxybutyryl-CoA epimerase/3-hydroxyacyl-CoA dehydrogenase/enoyl-CoA hydratase/3-hydroxybutyryl-CoA epimerase/enoyl-CoA isomerase
MRGGADPRIVRSVAIIGAGTMGAAVAAANVEHGLPVVIIDADDTALVSAPQRVFAEVSQTQATSNGQALAAVSRLVRCTTDPAEVASCDLVLESVTETAPAKHSVYAAVEPHLRATATLASNTSTIPIARLAAGLSQRHRFCGLHFFHPVRNRPLVEVVRGPETSDQTIGTAVAYAKGIGKMPIVVRDGPGFLVNRLLVPYLAEALELLLDGVAIHQIDHAATEFGMAMGPLRMLDEIGLDTAVLAGRVLWNAFPERISVSPLLITMFKAGRLGRKSGAGFFAYSNGGDGDAPGQPDPQLSRLLASWVRPQPSVPPGDVATRLLVPMVLEATRLLEEGTVHDPRSIDLGAIFGLGFPASRGGLLYWADTVGIERIVAMLRALEPLGSRMAPTSMLLDMARCGARFYADD